MATKQSKKKAAKPAAKTAQKAKRTAPKSCAAKRTNSAKTAGKGAGTTAKKASSPKKNIFDGASEVSVTDNKFVVTRTRSVNKNGRYENTEVREYHEKTAANVQAFNERIANGSVKKVSVKFD